MLRRKKVITSGVIYTIGNLLIQGMAFFTLPLYTRVLTKEAYGAFNLYNAWVILASLIIGLQTGDTFNSARVKLNDSDYQEYTRTALTVTNIFSGLIFLVAFLSRDTIGGILGLSSSIVILLLLQSYSNYVTGFLGQYFIQQQKANLTLLISAFSAITNVSLSILFIYNWENGYLARIVGQLIPSLITAFITLYYFYHRFEKLLVLKYVPFILSVSLPLIFHHLGHQLLNQLDRIMLGHMISVREVATYSFGYNIGLVLQIVLGGLNVSWIPWYFEAKKQGMTDLKTITRNYLFVGLFLTLGYLTIFPELAFLLGGEKYQDSQGFIGMIVLSYFLVFLDTFPVNIQFYHANTRYISLGTLLASGLNFIFNYCLIPILGVYGSALATVLSYICLFIFHHLLSRKFYKYDDVSLKIYLFTGLVALFYTSLVTVFLDNWLVRWGLGLLVLAIYGIYYKDDIVRFLVSKRGQKQ